MSSFNACVCKELDHLIILTPVPALMSIGGTLSPQLLWW